MDIRIYRAVLILFILTAFDFSKATPLVLTLDQKEVIIIGETHRRPESAQLVNNLVTEYLQSGKCLIVALEIPSHHQPFMDRALKGRASIYSIPLGAFIDHPAYRKMLSSFKEQIQGGKCLKVRAIDKPYTVSLDRDDWMERQIVDLMNGTTILVLAGNFHAMKEVEWSSDPLGGISLAERLVSRGIGVTSILQYWEKKRCDIRSKKLVRTDRPESSRYLEQITGAIYAQPPEKPSAVADAVVVWRCID